jgi:hypothetical protein
MGSWNNLASPVKIFDGVLDTSYADIDVSSIVGNRRTVLYCSYDHAGFVYCRPKDESYSTDFYYIYNGPHGVQSFFTLPGYIGVGLVVTDENGVFQAKVGWGTTASEIWLDGYFYPSEGPGMIDSGLVMSTGSYHDVDVSSLLGTNEALVIERLRRTTGAGHYSIASRPKGESRNFHGSYGASIGGQHGLSAQDTIVECILALTNSNGIHELGSDDNNTIEIYAYAAEIDKWQPRNQVVYDAATYRNVWFDVDTGEGRAGLALFKIEKETAGAGTGYRFVVGRKKGDTRNYLNTSVSYYNSLNRYAVADTSKAGIIAVPMDDNGIVQFQPRSQYVPNDAWKITYLGFITALKFEISSVVSSYLGLRVNFSSGCKNDEELNNPENYQIIVDDPENAFDFGIISVTPEPNVTYPTYVDLEVTDCTHNSNYELVITPNKITSMDDELLLADDNTKTFVGVSEMPEVLATISLSLTRVKVIFTKEMEQTDRLYNPSNYIWTGGIRTLKVEQDTNSSVILTVTEMITSQLYDLTVG